MIKRLQAALIRKLDDKELADRVITYLLAIGVAVVLVFPGASKAGPADELEKAVKALQAAKPDSEAQKQAGQRVCNIACGPACVALWTPAGSLVCRRIKGLE